MPTLDSPDLHAWQSQFRFAGNGRVPCAMCAHGPAFGADVVSTQAQYIADAIAAFNAAAKTLSVNIPDAVADMALGQVMGESNFGRSGTLGGNDWGAYQAAMTRAGAPVWIPSFLNKYKNGPTGVGGLAHRDSSPNTGSYVAYYRVYGSQYDAALDWLGSMAGKVGMANNPPQDAIEYATRVYLTGYFEGNHAGARPVGQRSEPYNEAEETNIADYANLVARNATSIAGVRGQGVVGRDPATIDFPSIKPIWERLSAGLVKSGASQADMVAAARKAFPSGGANGDYDALAKTNGLAWIVGPPKGYKKDGTKGWDTPWGKIALAVGTAVGIGVIARDSK